MPANYDDSALPPAQGPGLLTAIRRHPFLIVSCVIVAGALGALATFLLPTHYQADAQVVLGDQNDVTAFRTVPGLNATAKAQNAAQIMRSQAVYDRASVILNHRLSSSDVAGSVSVTPGATGNPLVTVTATQGSAKLARKEANAEGQAYLDITRAQTAARAKRTQTALERAQARMQAQIASLNNQAADRATQIERKASSIVSPTDRARYVQAALTSDSTHQALQNQATGLATSLATLKDKLQETTIDSSLLSTGVDTLYAAPTPTNPTSSNLKRNVAIAAALGLLIGAALAWRRFDRERGVDEVQVAATLGAPLLAKLKRDREFRTPTRVIDLSPGRRLPDDLRVLAASLMLHLRRRGLVGCVITSAAPREGKTVIALNLAATARSAGHDVVLVDGDIRNAELTHAFDMDTSPGLLDLLAGENIGQPFSRHSYASDHTLPFIPIGSGGDLAEPPMSELPALHHADGTSPAAIVDSPAIFEDPVALWLASGSAGLVVVVSSASTLDDLRALRSRADLAEAPILGFIVNDARPFRRRGDKPGRKPFGRRQRGDKRTRRQLPRHGEPTPAPVEEPSAVPTH